MVKRMKTALGYEFRTPLNTQTRDTRSRQNQNEQKPEKPVAGALLQPINSRKPERNIVVPNNDSAQTTSTQIMHVDDTKAILNVDPRGSMPHEAHILNYPSQLTPHSNWLAPYYYPPGGFNQTPPQIQNYPPNYPQQNMPVMLPQNQYLYQKPFGSMY